MILGKLLAHLQAYLETRKDILKECRMNLFPRLSGEDPVFADVLV